MEHRRTELKPQLLIATNFVGVHFGSLAFEPGVTAGVWSAAATRLVGRKRAMPYPVIRPIVSSELKADLVRDYRGRITILGALMPNTTEMSAERELRMAVKGELFSPSPWHSEGGQVGSFPAYMAKLIEAGEPFDVALAEHDGFFALYCVDNSESKRTNAVVVRAPVYVADTKLLTPARL